MSPTLALSFLRISFVSVIRKPGCTRLLATISVMSSCVHSIMVDHAMRYSTRMAKWYVLNSFRYASVLGWLRLGRLTKVAFVVLTCNENANTGLSDVELQQELERTITETRTIDGRWSIEKVTVL